MTNTEKYLSEILPAGSCSKVLRLRVGADETGNPCYGRNCDKCKAESLEWLQAEHKEPVEKCEDCQSFHQIEGYNRLGYCTLKDTGIFPYSNCEKFARKAKND